MWRQSCEVRTKLKAGFLFFFSICSKYHYYYDRNTGYIHMYMQLVVKGQYISHCMCQILFLNKKKYVYVHFHSAGLSKLFI